MEKKKNWDYISLASVVAAIAVVFLHANDCFWHFSATAGYWKTANVIECLFYFAVPVFFMISGTTLMDYNKKYDIKTYFKKRIKKTLIPYVVWSIVGLFFRLYYLENLKASDIDSKFIINGLLTGKIVGVYWFFISLFCIYLSIPLFSFVQESKRKSIFTYVCVVTFVLNALFPFINNALELGLSFSLSIGVGSGFLFYVLTGYLLSNYEISGKVRIVLYMSALLGFLLQLVGTYTLSMSGGYIDKTYKGYLNVPCILYSVGAFVFFRYEGTKLMKIDFIKKIVDFFKGYTFSLYLLHWFILQIILKLFSINQTSIYFRTLAPIAVLAVVVAVTWLIRKIPFLKNILP